MFRVTLMLIDREISLVTDDLLAGIDSLLHTDGVEVNRTAGWYAEILDEEDGEQSRG